MPSTFEDMKREIETGWDITLWSKSYGFGEAAKLGACIYLGCAQAYLGQQLQDLAKKVGPDLLEQALKDKGKIFGRGEFQVSAGTAYWSTYYNIWNPLRRRRERVTTDRYVRLYVRMRRARGVGDVEEHYEYQERSPYEERFEYPEYSGGLVYPINQDDLIQP